MAFSKFYNSASRYRKSTCWMQTNTYGSEGIHCLMYSRLRTSITATIIASR